MGEGNFAKMRVQDLCQPLYWEALMKYKWAMPKSLDEQNEFGVQKNSPGHQVPDFTPNIFIQYLIHWIIADDQVSVVLPRFC